MKAILTALLLMNLTYYSSQIDSKFLINDLKNYDKNQALSILRDSLWIKNSIWKNFGLPNIKSAHEVSFFVIPICNFSKVIKLEKYTETILNYLEVRKDYVSALITRKDSLIGFLFAHYTNVIHKKPTNDSLIEIKPYISKKELVRSNVYYWKINPDLSVTNIFLSNQIKFYHTIYYISKKPEITNYFLLADDHDEFFFIENEHLKVYSRFKDEVFPERDLINGIHIFNNKNDSSEDYYLLKK